jgi:ketosteroid isomerase-like protein
VLFQNHAVAQNKRFHRLRAEAESADGLAAMSDDDFGAWLELARTNAADTRYAKAARKDWAALLRRAEVEAAATPDHFTSARSRATRGLVVLRDTHRVMPEESTTPGPVALTRRAFEAVNQRDIDAVMSFFAPDAVLDGRVEVCEGRAAIRAFLDDWFGSFAELRMEGEEFVVLDDGVVLAVVNQEGRLVGVDRQVHQREGWVICWSADGLLVRLTTRTDIDEARAAAERLAESRG